MLVPTKSLDQAMLLQGGKTHYANETSRFSEKKGLFLAEQRSSYSQRQFSLFPGRMAAQGGMTRFSHEHTECDVNIITGKNVYRH